jgi:hypothetical protein
MINENLRSSFPAEVSLFNSKFPFVAFVKMEFYTAVVATLRITITTLPLISNGSLLFT